MIILVVDIGGTHVKVLATGQPKKREFASGCHMTAHEIVSEVRRITTDWQYDVVAIGYPGLVLKGLPAAEPHNLGGGWVGYDFAGAFGRPIRMINDAAMQALGSYRGGRMLFLGLGTGLGSALIVDSVLAPLELGELPYKKRHTYEDVVGLRGLERRGKKKWRRSVREVVALFRLAFEVDDIVIGGGNANLLKTFAAGVRRGDNDSAFLGGYRLWETGLTETGTHEPRP